MSNVVVVAELPAVVVLHQVQAGPAWVGVTRDRAGGVWVSSASFAYAADSYPCRMLSLVAGQKWRDRVAYCRASNPVKRNKLECLIRVGDLWEAASGRPSVFPDMDRVRNICTALAERVEAGLSEVPLPAAEPGPDATIPKIGTVHETQGNQGESGVVVKMTTTESEVDLVNMRGSLVPCQWTDNTAWVSFRECCNAIGIDFGTQFRKLKGFDWARVRLMTSNGADGKRYEMTMIDRKTFWGWLLSINVGKISDGRVKESVQWFHREALEALDAHFARKLQPAPAPAPAAELSLVMAELGKATTVLMTQQVETNRRLAAVEERLERLTPTADEWMLLSAYMKKNGMAYTPQTLMDHAKALGREMSRRGLQVREVHHRRYGAMRTYPESVLDDYFTRPTADVDGGDDTF